VLEGVHQQFSDSPTAQAHKSGKPNSHGIDGAETDPQQNVNEGNGHSYHSTIITEEGNPNIMEIVERREFNGIGINEEQISELTAEINPKNHAGLFVNVPIMYVDKEVSQVQSLETETLARLKPDGKSREQTKGTRAKVPKWTKKIREVTASKETEKNSGAVGKKRGHGKKKEEGGDRKRSKGETKNITNSMEADTQPRRAQ